MTALRDIRQRAGLTQTALAKQLNVSPEAVTMWESGARKPDIITIKKLSVILGVTTDELLAPIKVDVD